jgi:hypothetical protein
VSGGIEQLAVQTVRVAAGSEDGREWAQHGHFSTWSPSVPVQEAAMSATTRLWHRLWQASKPWSRRTRAFRGRRVGAALVGAGGPRLCSVPGVGRTEQKWDHVDMTAASRLAGVLFLASAPVLCWSADTVRLTHKLSWWPYQEGLVVSSLSVEVGDLKLNAMNGQFSLRVRVSGRVTGRKGWRPRIASVHASERFLPNALDEGRSARVEFTPVVEVSEDSIYSNEPVPYSIEWAYPLETWRFGTNTFELACGDLTETLEVRQPK